MILCSIPLLSALFSGCTPLPPFAAGYVEGEYVLIAPVTTARIEELLVARGDRISAGQKLASLEERDAEIALAQAKASVAAAESQLSNLKEGQRPEEISVIEASLASAQAQAAEAERIAARLASLTSRGAATNAELDDATTAANVAKARVAEMEANLVVARLPARPQEIAAAEANLEQARAAMEQSRWALDQRILTAPTTGTISDIIRYPGEIAGPAAPVLSLLPDGAVKLRLYVPESSLSRIRSGSMLTVHCDGCAPDLTARVIYVSDAPEFTPPVIYSLQNRQKLVYLIEARPEGENDLKPGQVVDVALEPATP